MGYTKLEHARWGAHVLSREGVRFHIWAPAQKRLALLIGDDAQPIPMLTAEQGSFELTTNRAGPGSRYQFVLDDGTRAPDPASRFQPEDVHGRSEVIDQSAYRWRDDEWHGRDWHEAVVYELHVGCFTPEGTFRAAREKLPHLANLGVTALELMPIADFPGARKGL